MKHIDSIMHAVDRAQEVVTGRAPEHVPHWVAQEAVAHPQPIEEPSVIATTDVQANEILELRREIAALRQEMYARVSGDMFLQTQESVAFQISSLWEFIRGTQRGSDRFLSFSGLLANNIAQRDPLFGNIRFCEAMLVAIGLTDRSEWAGLYWDDPRTEPALDGEGYAFLDAIARSGLIRLPEQASELDDIGFITVCYALILGRRPDADGLAHHLEALTGGAQRDDVIRLFEESEEAGVVRMRRRHSAARIDGRSETAASGSFWTDLYKLSRALTAA